MDAGGVELRHLRALIALVDEGTFTDAAIRLGVSQPVVSRTIAGLEAALGARLVERTSRSVALTDAGRRVHAAAVRALAAIEDVAAAAQGRSRPLRLGFAWSALGRHTTVVLRRWRAEHPHIELEVHRVDDLDGGLARGTADVVVVRGAVPLHGVNSAHIDDEPRFAALPAGHRLASRDIVTLADLTRETVLITPYGTTTTDLWPPAARPATLQVNNTDEWLTEIAGGRAVGVTAEATASQHAHPDVVFVPLAGAPSVPVHLVWPARAAHPAVPEFVALVSAVAAAHQRPD
jgi:DNA-binding transcriptional LysR family regulator